MPKEPSSKLGLGSRLYVAGDAPSSTAAVAGNLSDTKQVLLTLGEP